MQLEDRVNPTLNIWTGGAGDGLWASANNWSNLHTPTFDEDAIINSNVTVTHSTGTDTVHSLALSTGATLNLSGGSITDTTTLDAPTGDSHFNMAGGTLTGATVTAGSSVFATTTGGTLSGLTLAGTLDMTTVYGCSAIVAGGLTLNGGTILIGSNTGNYGLLSFDGGAQTLGGTGTVVFGTNVYDFLRAGPSSGSALTIGPNVLVHGATGFVGYSIYWGGPTDVTFTNQGTIHADTAGGTLSLGGKDWTNTGTVQATAGSSLNLSASANGWTSTTPVTIDGGGSLTLGGVGWTTAGITVTNSTLNLGGTFTRAGMGTFTRTGGTVNITGTLDNSNNTLALDAATGPWQLSAGTVTGGTVTTSGSNTLVGTTTGGKLSGVTLAGTLDLATVNASNATVADGLTLNGGTVLIGSNTGNYGLLQFDGGSQTLGGTGTVVYGANIYDFLRAGPTSGSSLTVGPNVTVRGHTGSVGYTGYWGGPTDVSVTVQGTIDADAAGGTISVMNDTNFAGGTLTGGTWESTAGILRLIGGNITTNAATLLLDGPNAHFYSDTNGTTDALAGLSTIAAGGSLTVNGRPVATAGRFTNAGALTVGPGGTFTIAHQYASSVIDFSSQYTPTSWSAAQALGPPNVPSYGDNSNAWTSSGANVGPAFLTLGFATPDFADGVIVRETLGNGFVTQIDLIDTDNVTHTAVWSGTDPSQPGTPVDFLASFPRTAYKVAAVKIDIDTNHDPYFEEVDSIQLVGPLTGFTQTDGSTRVADGGTLTLPAGASVDIQGGLLEGTGTIAGDVSNAGTVAPGPGLGVLTVTGNYTQIAAGTLAVNLGGNAAGTQYDQLKVAGSVDLDGGLTVGLVNGFHPNILDQFTVLDNSGASGIGNHFAGLAEGGRFSVAGPATFRISYVGGTGNDVALTSLNIAPTLDVIPDPTPILEDAGEQTINLTGITAGDVFPQHLTVTATSSNPGLIPNPTVVYSSPDSTGSLKYTPVANQNGTATITVTVTDDGGTGDGGVNDFTRTFTVTVTPVNDAPTLDAIPDPSPILEDSGKQTIPLSGITAGPNESQTLTVTATSDNPGLIPDPTITNSSPDAIGTLAFTPVLYQFGSATITVTVKDDGGTANGGVDTFTRTFTVAVTHIPHPPQLNTDPLTILPSVPMRTSPMAEPAGMLVAGLIAGRTFDPDGDPVGIAITGLDPANTITNSVPKFGVWQFTTDGTTWNPIPLDVSASKALVLSADANTRVRFLPNLKFHGLSRFTFLAWDHTDAATAGTTTDSTAALKSYSTAAERAWVAVGKTKPGVTDTGATRLAAVKEDAKSSHVFPVKSLLGLAGLENLPATNLGVAITGLSTATGTWQYRLVGTKTFVAIDPTASPTHALLLRPTDTVRFVPAANANGTGELTLKTWVPDANFGTYATDTTGTGFGRDSGAASISITAVNDAPVVDPNLHPTLGTVSAGQTTTAITVGDLLATASGVATDVDSTGLGVQLMPANSRVGKWRYFDTVANAWKDVTVAKKLTADVQVRFQAATGAAAGPVSLAFKAWDGKLLSTVTGTMTVTIG